MDAEEKEKQISSVEVKESGPTPEQEADIFFPEKEEVKIRDRTYQIESLKLRQMKLLLRLSKVNLAKIDEASIDAMTDGFSEILNEPDKDFLEKNLDVALIREILLKVKRQTYAGIPSQNGGPKGQRTKGEV